MDPLVEEVQVDAGVDGPVDGLHAAGDVSVGTHLGKVFLDKKG